VALISHGLRTLFEESAQTAGKRDQLIGKIQEKSGIAKEEAGRKVDAWGAVPKLDWRPGGVSPGLGSGRSRVERSP
jgi:hypothetical protein